MRDESDGYSMNREWRGWIFAVVFWTLFAASVGLYKRYQWLDTAWYIAMMIFLFAVSAYSVIYKFRHCHETSGISYQGIPRWLQQFSLDEENRDKSGTRGKVGFK